MQSSSRINRSLSIIVLEQAQSEQSRMKSSWIYSMSIDRLLWIRMETGDGTH